MLLLAENVGRGALTGLLGLLAKYAQVDLRSSSSSSRLQLVQAL
jgi:hypothetical protein